MSIKKNFIYSSILTISQYIFPLITFPYISRVLGVENIGLMNFVDSIINYFILFSSMGIAILGIREIAKNQNNKEKLNSVFSQLFIIHAITTIVFIIIYLLVIISVSKLIRYQELFLIGGLKILFTLFLIEWFFKGTENFKYITTRSIVIKILYVISVFIFIHSKEDYIKYFWLTAIMIIINAAYNWLYARKYITLKFTNINVKQQIQPFFKLGVYMLLTSMYTTFNVTYLGFVTTNKEVGYYTTSLKIYTIILSLYTAFSSVMLPRMSAIIGNNDVAMFKNIISKSFDILFSICFPIIVFIEIHAHDIIKLIAGTGYEGATILLRIIAPLVFVTGVAQIYAVQILMPQKKDKYILYASIIGAFVGCLLNILLIKHYRSIGSSIVFLLTEIIVTIFLAIAVNNKCKIKMPFESFLKNIVSSIPYILISLILINYNRKPLLLLFLATTVYLLYFYISQLYFVKNEIMVTLLKVKKRN